MAIKVNGKFVSGGVGGKGEDGKSAYDYAVDGGYTGTEAEFQALMAQAQNLDGGPFLPLSGGEMSGNIKSSGDCTVSFRQFEIISPQTGSRQARFYSTTPNEIVFFGSTNVAVKLTNLATPTQNTGAATKGYVDTSIQSAIIDSWSAAY